MTYVEEKEKWVNDYLDAYYLQSWRDNFLGVKKNTEFPPRGLELYYKGKCNLKCKYCYLNNYKEQLFPEEIDNTKDSLDNVKKTLDWLLKNKFLPGTLELFGGEAMSWKEYEILFGHIKTFLSALSTSQRNRIAVIVPINVIFFKNDSYYQLFLNTQKEFCQLGSGFFLSFSLDGKFCDPHSRPPANKNFEYSDSFYELISKFCREAEIMPHFHPMVSRENIRYWKKNFLWFINFIKRTYNLKEVSEAIKYLYLLEVRNWDWKTEELKEFRSFLKFVLKYLSKHLSKQEFINYLFYDNKLNIFSFLGFSNKGLSCSLQHSLYLRTPDMTVAPCHRLFYQELITAKLHIDKEANFFEPIVPYPHLAANSTNFRNNVPCSLCEINHLCTGPCLGSNYEKTRDIFTTPREVCALEKSKYYIIVKTLKELGLFEDAKAVLTAHLFDRVDNYAVFQRKKLQQLNTIEDAILSEEKDE